MPSIAEYRERKIAAAKEIRRLADLATGENRDFSAEEKTAWDRCNADYDAAAAAVDKLERADKIDAELREGNPRDRRIGRDDYDGREERERDQRQTRRDRDQLDNDAPPTDRQRSDAIGAWVRHQAGRPLAQRQRDAARACGINPSARTLTLRRDTHGPRNPLAHAREQRALSATTGSTGGYTVPSGFVARFETALLQFGGVRQAAEVMTTDSGNELPWPTANDTGNKGERIGENTAVAEQDIAVGAVIFNAYKYSSKLVKVPIELLEDSAFDIASELGRMLGERIGRITNDDFTTGTNASMPNGIATAATSGVTTASATAITGDEILDLIYSVDPAYRDGAAFMMHDSIVKVVRKLKDTTNQYLWVAGLNSAEPDRLANYPIVKNQSMASAATALARTMLFGQLSKYKIRDVRSIRIRRLVERYADSDQEGFVAFSRHDGDLLDAGTRPVKALDQHA